MAANTRHCADEKQTIAGAGGVDTGTMFVDTAGTCWFSQNLRKLEEGEAVKWRRNLVVEIDKENASDVFADNALVGWNATNKTAVATTTGDFDIGRVREPSGNGVATVYVELFSVHATA